MLIIFLIVALLLTAGSNVYKGSVSPRPYANAYYAAAFQAVVLAGLVYLLHENQEHISVLTQIVDLQREKILLLQVKP